MQNRERRYLRAVLIAALLLAAGGTASFVATNPAAVSADGGDIFLPLALHRFEGPFPDPPSVAPPSDTAVPPETAGPTATATDAPTEAPTATPTLPGAPVDHPTEPDEIIVQIGMTDTAEAGAVWEEMNGTPWFTLYGDGRVIAGRALDDLDQPLFEGRLTEYGMQSLLRELVHVVEFAALQEDYVHPREATPEIHVFLNLDGGEGKRVGLRGFTQFVSHGADDFPEDAESIMKLVAFVQGLEAELLTESSGGITVPFVPECYTILAQDIRNSPLLDDPPKWEGSVGVQAIARAAPTAASNYIDRVVGHRFVQTEIGQELSEYVVPIAKVWFPWYKRASEFAVGSRPHAVGVRKEVPGGSKFLPNAKVVGGWGGGTDFRRRYWYRRDAGSGSCPSLPNRPVPPLFDAPAGGWLSLEPALRLPQEVEFDDLIREMLRAREPR